MEGALSNLTPVTNNCRGCDSSILHVQNLFNDYQIIFLQETMVGKTTA